MNRLRQFAAFGLVGVVGFAVDVGVLYLVAPGVGLYGGRVLSFVCAATLTWWLNRRFTFKSAAGRDSRATSYLRYMISMLAGAALNYAAYAMTLHWLHANWAPALGVALGSVAGLFVNFNLARHWAFGESPATPSVADALPIAGRD